MRDGTLQRYKSTRGFKRTLTIVNNNNSNRPNATSHPLTWWAVEDLNLGPLACEASALTTELTAPGYGLY